MILNPFYHHHCHHHFSSCIYEGKYSHPDLLLGTGGGLFGLTMNFLSSPYNNARQKILSNYYFFYFLNFE